MRVDKQNREFEQRERDIVNAAMEMFKQGDIASVSIAQIATAADIGKGTIYKHFRSKEEIYACIVLNINKELRVALEQVDTALVFQQRLGEYLQIIWDAEMRDANFLRRVSLQMLNNNFLQKLGKPMLHQFDQGIKETEALYLKLLEQAQVDGEIVSEPLDQLYFCISAAFDGAVLGVWQRREMGADISQMEKETIVQLKKFIIRAICLKQ